MQKCNWIKSQLRYVRQDDEKRHKRPWIDYEPIEKFTLLLVFVGLLQAWAFIQSERAFVSIGAMNPEGGKISEDKPVAVWVELKNSGHIAAKITVNMNFKVFEKLPEKPEYSNLEDAAFSPTVADGVTTTKYTYNTSDGKPFYFSRKMVEEINGKKSNFYIFGYIKYRDDLSIFVPRVTGFCYHYTPDGDPAVSLVETCRETNYTY